MNSNKQDVRGRRKTTSFSMVSNPIIDSKDITPAAGWLYVLIQRWVTYNAEGFICSKSFLASKYQSGYRMFNRAWDELKEAGYLKMYSHPTEGWEFDLLDVAQPDTPHTYYLDINGQVKSTNVDRAEKKAAKAQEKEEKDHYPQNDSNGDHYPQNDSNGNDSNGNGGNNINTFSNSSYKNKNNTSLSNQSIYHSEEPAQTARPKKKKIDRLIDEELVEEIKEQIFYDELRKVDKIQEDEIDLAVDVLAEMLTATEPDEIGGRSYAPEFIKERATIIDYTYMQYVFECIHAQTEKIYNIRKYMKTAIFNAPATIGSYYANAVRSDMAKKATSSQGSFGADEFFEIAVKSAMGENFDPAILKQ